MSDFYTSANSKPSPADIHGCFGCTLKKPQVSSVVLSMLTIPYSPRRHHRFSSTIQTGGTLRYQLGIEDLRTYYPSDQL